MIYVLNEKIILAFKLKDYLEASTSQNENLIKQNFAGKDKLSQTLSKL